MVRLSHVHLPVSDPARSIEFYRDSLGFQIGYQDETMAVVDTIGVLLDQAEDPTAIGTGVVVGLTVDDVDTEYQRLIDRGVTTVSGPEDQPWGARNFYLRDPDGHQIEFEQPAGQTK